METVIRLTNAAAAQWAGILGPVLLQSTLLAILVYLVTRVPRVPAAARFWLWMLVPVRLLVMPLLTVRLPLLPGSPAAGFGSVGTVGPVSAAMQGLGAPAASPGAAEQFASSAAASTPGAESIAGATPTVWSVVLFLWLAGVVVCGVRLFRAWLGMRALVRSSRCGDDPELAGATARAADAVGMRRRPRVLVTGEEISPCAHGVFRPVVILPEKLARTMGGESLETILAHEFAHLRRRDPLTGWLIALGKVLYFFHPAVYLAQHFILFERERVCDECVLSARRMSPAVYARALIEAASDDAGHRRRVPAMIVTAESFTQLRRRLQLLGAGGRLDGHPSRLWTAVLVAATCAAAPGVALTEHPSTAGLRDLAVHVFDAEGRPVAGAGVEVISGFRPIAGATSDAEGLARLSIPAAARVQWVVGLSPGVGMDYFECYEPRSDALQPFPPGMPASELPESVRLTLDGARTVRIGAIDPSDRPIAEAAFSPWRISKVGKRFPVNLSGSDLAIVETGRDGTATFEWIPRETWNDAGCTFIVRSPGYSWPDAPEGVYERRDDVELTASLKPTTTISGTVRHEDGRPARGMQVVAEGRRPTINFCRASAVTDDRGAYAMTIDPDQTYTVAAVDPAWTARVGGVEARSGGPVRDIDLTLTPGVLIHGQLVPSESAEGPVAGELVVLGHSTRPAPADGEEAGYWGKFREIGLHERVKTDDEGRFSFRVVPGDYLLLAPGTDPGTLHAPMRVSVPPDAPAERTLVIQRLPGASVLGSSAAPLRVARGELLDYAVHSVYAGAGPKDCMQCHRPHREPVRVHRGG